MNENRVALVTGAASGIGRAVCLELSTFGHVVVAADANLAGAKETVGMLSGTSAGSFAVELDVTDEHAAAAVADAVVARFGRIDVLVCSAGVAGRNAAATELTAAEWRQVLDVNLTGVFLMCQKVIPHMVRGGWGRVVNIASIAGKEGNPNAAAYSASKAGVIGLTKALGKEVAQTGVLVNCVTPAVIATPILAQVSDAHLEYMTSKIPMGRVGQPGEVAAMIRFLCSEDLSFSTGAVFDISGGRATY